MKDPYHCPYCNQRSTRRWNLQVHIKRKHGGSPGPYLASHPFSYNVQSDPFGSLMVADSAGDTFLNMHLPEQTPITNPIYPPPTIHDQSHETGLSHAAVQKNSRIQITNEQIFSTPYESR